MTSTIETLAHPSRNRMRTLRRRAAVLSLLATTSGFASPDVAPAQSLDPDRLLAHVRYLADDALGGREAGEPGADSAAAYIGRAFASFGLEPLTPTDYELPFQVTTTLIIDPESRLVLTTGRGERVLELYEEWLPFNFSGAGSLSAAAVQAGYGLDEESYAEVRPGPEWTEVVVLRGGTPEDFDPHGSGFDPTPRRKATAARDQGADAVLITVPRIAVPQAGDPPHAVGIPAIQVIEDEEILDWLDDEDLQIRLDANVQPKRATTANVAARLPGRDARLADELIVIGAHYDHLGMGGPGSMAPDLEAVHNGADDNASGTSLLLGLAEYFAKHPERRPARSLAFVAFAAEEMGLLGSEHFVSHPPFRLESVAAMINFDMVGRLRDGKLQVFGSETAEEFSALLDSLDAASPLTLSLVGDGYGPSDQTSFYARKIPVLHLFTGTHSEYHRPEDDWQLINAEGMAQVGELAIALIRDLGNRTVALQLVEQQRPQPRGGGGYGPYLGTIPDFGEVEGGGLRLSGVRAGSPAERAGLQAQDVVVEFGGKEVLNIYDYTYALRAHAPGDTVAIKVRRDGEMFELTAILGRRQ